MQVCDLGGGLAGAVEDLPPPQSHGVMEELAVELDEEPVLVLGVAVGHLAAVGAADLALPEGETVRTHDAVEVAVLQHRARAVAMSPRTALSQARRGTRGRDASSAVSRWAVDRRDCTMSTSADTAARSDLERAATSIAASS